MKKYNIVNKATNQIICKRKNGGKYYRQNKDSIEQGLIPVCTTIGRAEEEKDFLERAYGGNWSVVEVE